MITHLGLSHFRSYRRLSLDLGGVPVAIWGANGAGKTNILEAISFLSPGRGLRRASADEPARRPEQIGWKVEADIDGPDGAHEVQTQADRDGARSLAIDGKPAPQVALGKIERILWLVPAMDRLWIEPAEGRRRFLDRMTLSFMPTHAEAVLAYEKAMRERNRLLRDDVRDPRWYDALEDQMATTGWQIILNRAEALARIATAQSAAHTTFPAADLSMIDPDDAAGRSSDAETLREAFGAGRMRDMAAGRTLSGPHRADLAAIYRAKDMPAAQCSTGEQKALLISLVLANARALAGERGAPPVLLLDEVAAHLDAARRAALFAEVTELGCQAWMTGTGPELFAEIAGRAECLVVAETPDGSTASHTAATPAR